MLQCMFFDFVCSNLLLFVNNLIVMFSVGQKWNFLNSIALNFYALLSLYKEREFKITRFLSAFCLRHHKEGS